ncbi:MAG: hypothetical protein ACXADS_07805 [Candidatus Thorarchaeota archaeon]
MTLVPQEERHTFTSLRYPTPRQGLIWLKRRQKSRPSDIARELDVSRQFVSKAQRMAEKRIANLLKHAASVNRVKVKHLSGKYGIAVGYCPTYQTDTYVIYSPTLGVQTWFTHTGECGDCSERPQCEKTLRQLAIEWEISFREDMPPTELGNYLFNTVMRRLRWKDESDPD